jgi:hypothetical protein
MKKQTKRLTLHRETLRYLTAEHLQEIAAGRVFTVGCPCTRTCDSCIPCTIGVSCRSGVACTA